MIARRIAFSLQQVDWQRVIARADGITAVVTQVADGYWTVAGIHSVEHVRRVNGCYCCSCVGRKPCWHAAKCATLPGEDARRERTRIPWTSLNAPLL